MYSCICHIVSLDILAFSTIYFISLYFCDSSAACKYLQPILVAQTLQETSATVCIPVSNMRSSLTPAETLIKLSTRYAGPCYDILVIGLLMFSVIMIYPSVKCSRNDIPLRKQMGMACFTTINPMLASNVYWMSSFLVHYRGNGWWSPQVLFCERPHIHNGNVHGSLFICLET